MRDMLTWAVTAGQKFAPSLGYIPLPANVVSRVKTEIGKIK
jgi:ABC-type phosphate transport system substrate-binding protein